MRFDLTYRLSEAEFIAACNALWSYRAIGKRGNLMLAAILAGLGGFLIWQGVPGLWGLALILGAVIIFVMTTARDRVWRRAYRSSPKYESEIRTQFGPDGLHVQSAEGENDVPWSFFRRFLRTDEAFFLIRDGRVFSIIPMTAFADDQQVLAFEGLLTERLKRMPRRYL